MTPHRDRRVCGPECGSCLRDLAHQAAVLAAADPDLRARAEAEATAAFEPAVERGLTSPEVANIMYRRIRRVSGTDDPFQHEKLREMALAREVFDKVRPLFGDDLRSCLILAALGNTLDFFIGSERAMELIHREIDGGFAFYHDDADRLEKFLEGRPDRIMYLTDNAGEIYFDLPLYDKLTEFGGRVALTVKGGPSLNDLGRAEIEAAGLADRFQVLADNGADGAGVDWGAVSPEFVASLERADLIVAKGMANMETLIGRDLPAPVFFLFKVKCRPIQDYLHAPPDTFWALWQEASPAAKKN
ncbi:MAG: DUF89 family protein [Proteobacteria bacterium]|nr:DUF89 family protein [Pseudomonadota bacterium]MBU1742853.1 DUF89 family protein [Pseudomonadota bacterium]